VSYQIRPLPGLKIRDPEHEGRILPPEGIKVNKLSPFWLRRLRDESITIENLDSPPVRPIRPLSREEV